MCESISVAAAAAVVHEQTLVASVDGLKKQLGEKEGFPISRYAILFRAADDDDAVVTVQEWTGKRCGSKHGGRPIRCFPILYVAEHTTTF